MLSGKVVARVVRHGEAEVVHLYDAHCPSMAFPAKTDSQRILDAAMILLAREGLRGMSLRAVAVSLKIAPNVIYRYFRDHAHLEAAVGAEVCRRLHAVLRKAAHGREPEAAARATAKAYLKFARDNALLYEALLIPRPASGDEAADPEQLWLFVVGQAARLTGEARAPEAAVSLWAFLHGIAALQSAQLLGHEKPATSFDFGLNAWLSAAREFRPPKT
jgi:AcrR family transcriptional regulator